MEALVPGREELGVDAGRVAFLVDQFDLQIAGVGEGDRQRHLAGLAAIEPALRPSAQDVPGADTHAEPGGHRLVEVTDDIAELAHDSRQCG